MGKSQHALGHPYLIMHCPKLFVHKSCSARYRETDGKIQAKTVQQFPQTDFQVIMQLQYWKQQRLLKE